MTTTPTDDNDSKTRNTKSWKTEAQKLEALLVQACEILTNPTFDVEGGDPTPPHIDKSTDLADWWRDHRELAQHRTDNLKASGLAKLTADERQALGLDA